ncbi:MAG: hypothetical protein CMF45_08275 [Legionellales bacterium]|nr:hypothetical protein [Legionellales bacterium]|tara:strand:- start:8132 stop:9943 length:1812 start_codon:yes stop_codon:yes gene_type:complete
MKSYKEYFIFLWKNLSKKNKNRFFIVFLITVFLSVFEAASLGSLVPFLTAVTSPESILNNDDLMQILRPMGIDSSEKLALYATLLFIFITILTGGLRFYLIRLQYLVAHRTANDFSANVFNNMISREYSQISEINSSEIIAVLTQKMQQFIASTLLPFLMLVSSSMVFIVLMVGLLIIDWQLTSGLILVLGFTYGSGYFLFRKKIFRNSQIMSFEGNLLIKVIQETFGGIREIILGNHKEAVRERFDKSDRGLRDAQSSTLFLAACPKMLIEVVVFVMVALIAYSTFSEMGSVVMSIPTLGALAYAAQRMLPIMQQVYANVISIRGSKDIVKDICDLLLIPKKSENADCEPINQSYKLNEKYIDIPAFHDSIIFKDVFFKYRGEKYFALENINLEIRPGNRIGIFGKTGSGKSTLLDIIMGLLQPSSGEIFCDGIPRSSINREEWYRIFSHVPQSIFLSDTSVISNIAGLGNNVSLNEERALVAAELAHIKDDIEKLNDGFNTIVGERGLRLSGGQLQRLGIARALYEPSRILVLDEATSAIDPIIERRIETSLNGLQKDITVIKVAHRISTLEGCDIIYEIEDGQIVRSGDYKTVFNIKPES